MFLYTLSFLILRFYLFIYLFQDKLLFFFLVYNFLHEYVECYWVVHLVLGNMDYIWDPTDHWEN